MKITKIKLLAIVIAVIPLIVTLFLYNSLPAEIPTNWSLDGGVRYGSRFTIIPLSAIGIFCTIGLFVSPKLDPRRKNYEFFQKYYDYFVVALNTFLCVMVFIVLSESLNPGNIQVSRVITFVMGVLFALIGNFMPKIKDNFFIGIKNPWTLSDPVVWNKTHRLAGMLFFLGGIFISIIALIIKNDVMMFTLFFIIIMLISLYPMVMSYIWYKKLNK